MSYSVTQLKADITGALHGTTTNQIQNLDGVIERAARQLLLDIDPMETIREAEFSSPIFNSVYDYPVASDVKGTRLIDIYPQVNRLPRDIWLHSYNQAFDISKQNIFQQLNMFTFNYNTGVRTIRINAPYLNPPVVINSAESLTSNGTWAASGTASSLSVDNTNYVQGAGSLSFNVTSGAAIVTNSTMTQVNLSSYVSQSSLFTWVYVPNGSYLTSVELKWGSDASNYYSSTVTVNQDAVAFVNGWNLCKFDWSTATTTGTPVSSAIDYVQVTLNVTASMNGCHINVVESILGTIISYEYYSSCLFRDSGTGAFQESITDDSNLINLGIESYNLLFNKCVVYAARQQQGIDATMDVTSYETDYEKGKMAYVQKYKSQAQKPQTIYYRQPDVSNRRFIGRRYNY